MSTTSSTSSMHVTSLTAGRRTTRRSLEAGPGSGRGRARQGEHTGSRDDRRYALGRESGRKGRYRDDLRRHRRLLETGARGGRRRRRLRIPRRATGGPRSNAAALGEGGGRDSNPRPPGPQPGALPTELPPPRRGQNSLEPVRVLSSRRFPGPAWDELRDVDYFDWPLTVERPGAEALAVVARPVDDALLELLPGLRLVANYGAGYELVDVEACRAREITVTNTPGAVDAATADLAFALMLAVRRRIVEGDRYVRARRWGTGWAEEELMGDDVSGATLGIVGLGGIGRAVARRARAFDMRVLYAKRERLAAEVEAALGIEHRELDDLFAEADIVTLHVPHTPETERLVDARRLALLRDGACLVNTARGAIVDEEALVRELVSGRIRAGLDVFVHEPRVPQALFELPNVVLAPHLGTALASAREAMTRVLVDNLLAFERGERPPNMVS